jgi:hypothetical protein
MKNIQVLKTTANLSFLLWLTIWMTAGSLLYSINIPMARAEGALEISTCEDLQRIGDDLPLDGDYILDSHINCSASATWNADPLQWEDENIGGTLIPDSLPGVVNNGYNGFRPIGDGADPFTGSFDGNGFTISNLWIFRPNEENIGLFGYAVSADINNVRISNSTIIGGSKTGAVAGQLASGETITSSGHEGSGNTVRAYLSTEGGGIFGAVENVTVSAITNTGGNVHGSGNIIGGLIGVMHDSSLSSSSSSANVDGGFALGGAVGEAYGSGIFDVNVSANIHANTAEFVMKEQVAAIGGVVGCAHNTDIFMVSYSGEITATNAGYGGNMNTVGGLVGCLRSNSGSSSLIDSNSSGNITLTNAIMGNSVGGIGGAAGLVVAADGDSISVANISVDGNIRINSTAGQSQIYGLGGIVGIFENFGISTSSEGLSFEGNIDVTTSGDTDIGSIAGIIGNNLSSVSLTGVSAKGRIKIDVNQSRFAAVQNVGGLVGIQCDSSITICDMYRSIAAMAITIDANSNNPDSEIYLSNIGGAVGSWQNGSGSEVDQVVSTGSIILAAPGATGEIYNVGGFVGAIFDPDSLYIGRSYSRSSIYTNTPSHSAFNLGGFIGLIDGNDEDSITIQESYSIGDINLIIDYADDIGGFVGEVYTIAEIDSSFRAGSMHIAGDPDSDWLAGFVAYSATSRDQFFSDNYLYHSGSYNFCYSPAQEDMESGCEVVDSLDYFRDINNQPLYQWDFEGTWRIDSEVNNGFPTFLWYSAYFDPTGELPDFLTPAAPSSNNSARRAQRAITNAQNRTDYNDFGGGGGTAPTAPTAPTTPPAPPTAPNLVPQYPPNTPENRLAPSPFTNVVETVSQVTPRTFIKGQNYETVYYVTDNFERRPFLNEQVFATYASSFNEVQVVTDATLPFLRLGTPMLPKAGTTFVKLQSLRDVFATESNGIEGAHTKNFIPSEAIAEHLAGSNWNAYIIDIPVTAFRHYVEGRALTMNDTINRSILRLRESLRITN